MASRLVAERIEAGYGAVRVLHGLSIRVEPGEGVVLLGSNGNGKSTLIKCIMGIVRPSSGAIYLERDGERIDLVGRSPQDVVELGIALVPEGRRLFPMLTVEENLVLGAYRRSARARLAANLEFVYGVFPTLKQRRAQSVNSVNEKKRASSSAQRPPLSSS